MDLHGSHLGSLGFSCTDIYESVSMCFKDAICLRKILLKMALDTVYINELYMYYIILKRGATWTPLIADQKLSGNRAIFLRWWTIWHQKLRHENVTNVSTKIPEVKSWNSYTCEHHGRNTFLAAAFRCWLYLLFGLVPESQYWKCVS